jgi:outer membrane protein
VADTLPAEHPVYKLRPTPYSDAATQLVTLDELLELAVDHNLGLKGQDLSIEKSHYVVDQTYYQFDPSIAGSLNYSKRTSGGAAAAQQGGVSGSEVMSGSFDYTMPLIYGDSIGVGYELNRSNISLSGTGTPTEIPTTYGSGISLNYSRPLLRGSGRLLRMIPRYQASNNLLLSYNLLDDQVRLLKKNVIDAYFLAVAQREAIGVREAALEVALAQLERAVERYKVGLAIQADVLQAENNVLNQRSALLQAREDIETTLDSLTTLVGIPVEFDLAVDADGALIDLGAELPADLWTLVRDNSYDLKSINTQLANLRLNRKALEDRTKPALDLNMSIGRTGEDTTLGPAIGGLENQSYQVGISWNSTPGERVAKADVAQNELDIAGLDLQIQNTELELKTRLRDLERDLEVKRQQIVLAESNVIVVRQTLDIAIARQEVGLATTLEVIEIQEDLLSAELALLQARVAYQQSYREILLLAGLI